MNKNLNLLTLIFCFLLYFNSNSQNYSPLDTSDYKQRKKLIERTNNDFLNYKKTIKKSYQRLLSGKLQDIYTKKNKNFVNSIKDKEIVFNEVFTKYIDSITDLVVAFNPSIKNEHLKVYLSRFNSPNALSFGNGIIVLNMGLFKFLETESQLVSVLTHEIAHQKLKHVKNNILNKTKENLSSKRRKENYKLRKQKYNQYDKAFSVLKELLYTNSKKYRKQESEADFLGYELYKKTNFNKTGFVNALRVLHELDSLPNISLDKGIYKTFFDLPKLPFNEEWITQKKSNKYTYFKSKDKIDKDSLKSHPEILERIDKLIKANPELSLESNQTIKSSAVFKKLQRIARFEDVANLHHLKKYGLSTYLTLNKLANDPTNKIYKDWLGKNFIALYNAKKEYQLNNYVDTVSPNDEDKSYQTFLNFVWKLNLNDLIEIGDYYSNI